MARAVAAGCTLGWVKISGRSSIWARNPSHTATGMGGLNFGCMPFPRVGRYCELLQVVAAGWVDFFFPPHKISGGGLCARWWVRELARAVAAGCTLGRVKFSGQSSIWARTPSHAATGMGGLNFGCTPFPRVGRYCELLQVVAAGTGGLIIFFRPIKFQAGACVPGGGCGSWPAP